MTQLKKNMYTQSTYSAFLGRIFQKKSTHFLMLLSLIPFFENVELQAFDTNLTVTAFATGRGQINVFDNTRHGALFLTLFPFSSNYSGGVRIAMGDVNGDSYKDLVVGAGPGNAPLVKVFDGLALRQGTVSLLASFLAFGERQRGGLYVATGNVEISDKEEEVIVGGGTTNRVRCFNIGGGSGTLIGGANNVLSDFAPYDPSYKKGVRVAAANVDGIEGDEIVSVPVNSGQKLPVAISRISDGNKIFTLLPYTTNFKGGMTVAVSSITTNNAIITNSLMVVAPNLTRGKPQSVRVYNIYTNVLVPVTNFFPFGTKYRAAIQVGFTDWDDDGNLDILCSSTAANTPQVKVYAYNGSNLFELAYGGFVPFGNTHKKGVRLAE